MLSFPGKPCTASTAKSSTLKPSNNPRAALENSKVDVSPNPSHRRRVLSPLRLVSWNNQGKHHSSRQRPETLRNKHQQMKQQSKKNLVTFRSLTAPKEKKNMAGKFGEDSTLALPLPPRKSSDIVDHSARKAKIYKHECAGRKGRPPVSTTYESTEYQWRAWQPKLAL